MIFIPSIIKIVIGRELHPSPLLKSWLSVTSESADDEIMTQCDINLKPWLCVYYCVQPTRSASIRVAVHCPFKLQASFAKAVKAPSQLLFSFSSSASIFYPGCVQWLLGTAVLGHQIYERRSCNIVLVHLPHFQALEPPLSHSYASEQQQPWMETAPSTVPKEKQPSQEPAGINDFSVLGRHWWANRKLSFHRLIHMLDALMSHQSTRHSCSLYE